MKWVTDPAAIDTIIGLGGLHPGDELKLARGYFEANGQCNVIRVLPGYEDHIGKPESSARGEPILVMVERVRPKRRAYDVCRSDIIAWRRPTHERVGYQ